MATPLKGTENLHSVSSHRNPLGVECRGCGHRKLALHEYAENGQGNMRELRTLKFVCSCCGSREWNGWLFNKKEDADAFVSSRPSGGPAVR